LLAGRRYGRSRLHDPFQSLLLELHVLFAGFNQFWQFIVPLLEEYINIGPGFLDVFSERYQVVVDFCEIQQQDENNREKNNQTDHFDTPFGKPNQYIIVPDAFLWSI